MQKQSSNTISAKPDLAGARHVDLQRRAMQALLDLSADVVRPDIDEIEQTYRNCQASKTLLVVSSWAFPMPVITAGFGCSDWLATLLTLLIFPSRAS